MTEAKSSKQPAVMTALTKHDQQKALKAAIDSGDKGTLETLEAQSKTAAKEAAKKASDKK